MIDDLGWKGVLGSDGTLFARRQIAPGLIWRINLICSGDEGVLGPSPVLHVEA